MSSRVVLTGIGMMGGWGAGREDFLSLLSGRAATTPLDQFDFDAHIDTRLLRRADHIARCALTAAVMALRDAGISLEQEDAHRVGALLGTVHGALSYTLNYHASLVRGDPRMASPLLFSDSVPNAPVSHLSTTLGIRGYTMTTQGYCAVAQGLTIAAGLVQQGTLDVCLVGGADVNHDFLVNLYDGCLAHPEKITATLGGSGFVVLESLDHARKRGAVPYARLDQTVTVTATYDRLKRLGNSLFKTEALTSSGCLFSSAFEDNDSVLRQRLLLKGVLNPPVDCSAVFGHGFAAAEAFQIILALLTTKSPGTVSACLTMPGLPVAFHRVSLLRSTLAGGNSMFLFSRNI